MKKDPKSRLNPIFYNIKGDDLAGKYFEQQNAMRKQLKTGNTLIRIRNNNVKLKETSQIKNKLETAISQR